MLKAIPYRYRVLALLCSLTTLTYLDRICISIVGVRIKSEFGLDNEQFGWVLSAFSLAYAIFEIPSGIENDSIIFSEKKSSEIAAGAQPSAFRSTARARSQQSSPAP